MRKAINRFKTVGSTLVVGVLLTFGLSACGESNNIDCADLTIHMDDTGRSVTFQDGTTTTLRRRERPQFITFPNGTLAAFTNGVEPNENLHQGRTFTMVSIPK